MYLQYCNGIYQAKLKCTNCLIFCAVFHNAFSVSVYGVDNGDDIRTRPNLSANPLKGKPRLSSLSKDREKEVALAVSNFVMGYDAENCAALESFQPVKQGTECIFARRAKVWGAQDWNPALSLGNVH